MTPRDARRLPLTERREPWQAAMKRTIKPTANLGLKPKPCR